MVNYISKNMRQKFVLWYLNTFVAKYDEYYSYDAPNPKWMEEHHKIFWIQPQSDDIDIIPEGDIATALPLFEKEAK
jgi:hypothetical protein